MPRRFDADDDDDDRDDPLPADQALGAQDDDELDPMPCPYCGRPMSERQEVCPRCGSFVLREDVPGARRPLWARATIVLLIAALAAGLIFFR